MTIIDPGIDLVWFLAAVITWLSPLASTLIAMAVALELLWQGLAWSDKVK